MPPRHFARMRHAWQEGRSGKAILSSIAENVLGIAVRCAARHLAQAGTLFAGLRTPTELIVIVVTLLAYGCPIQAIVHAYGLDERSVASCRDRAGKHCQQVHQAIVLQGQLDVQHVQADEIRVKGHRMVVWMGLALMDSTRLWLGGVVSLHRDRSLADRLLQQVRACCLTLRPILICTDGWSAYPGSILRAFREKVKETVGRGRACLRVWSELCIAIAIKHPQKKRVVEVRRKLLQASLGGVVFNTAFIDRFNGTMRERLASLTRRCRHAARRLETLETGMYLIGCTDNFCWPHHELSKAKHVGHPCTPAMASGLTNHIWSLHELFTYKIAPAPWAQPPVRDIVGELPERQG